MTSINLFALTQISFEEIGGFLSWLSEQPSTGVSLAQLQKTPPIRTSKLNPMIKSLEHFGFVTQKQGRITLLPRGRDFLGSEISVRKAVIRALFNQVDWVQKIVDAIQTSPTGRAHRSVIQDSFDTFHRVPIAESEVISFISWGQACDLFGYDKKSHELLRTGMITPQGPSPVVPNLPLAS